MKQPSFAAMGIVRVIKGGRRPNESRGRWYCEGSGSPSAKSWRAAVICPVCGRMLRTTCARRLPNHGRAEASA